MASLARTIASAGIAPNVADLSVTKTADKSHANVGEDVTYTIISTNGGPDTETGVKVTDNLPAGLTYKSSSATAGSYASGTGIWTVGSLTNGSSASLTLVATVTQLGSIANTANVTGAPFDPVAPNNSDATSFDQLVDLAVAKSVDNTAPNVGSTATFTVTVSNAGPSVATGVVIHDALPIGLTWSSDTPSQGAYNHTTGDWSVGSVASSGTATLTVHATVAGSAAMTNTASVKAVDEPQVGTANDTASATVTPPHADLAVTKTVAAARPNVGDGDTFTVTVTNHGPDTATNVALSDVLPAGITFVSASASQGAFVSGTGVWTVGSLGVDDTETLTVQVSVAAAGDYTNTATISHSDQFDPAGANDSAAAQVWTRVADISIAKTVDKPVPPVGSVVTFTITATNAGPDPASQLVVGDALTADFAFVSATPSQGSYDPAGGSWTLGGLAVDADATLQIKARVVASGHLANTASLDSLLQRDPNGSNDSATATMDAPNAADLSLTKTVDDSTPDLNSNVSYTVAVTNHGPNATTGVAVHDALPAGMTYVSSTGYLRRLRSGHEDLERGGDPERRHGDPHARREADRRGAEDQHGRSFGL